MVAYFKGIKKSIVQTHGFIATTSRGLEVRSVIQLVEQRDIDPSTFYWKYPLIGGDRRDRLGAEVWKLRVDSRGLDVFRARTSTMKKKRQQQ